VTHPVERLRSVSALTKRRPDVGEEGLRRSMRTRGGSGEDDQIGGTVLFMGVRNNRAKSRDMQHPLPAIRR
jgi:hypothetical protein